MPEIYAFMHITGRTLEESLTFMNTKKINVHHGRQKILFKHMPMAASMSTDANILMDGKSRNIILLTTKCMLAVNKMYAQNLIAHIFILIVIGDSQFLNTLRFFPKTEDRLLVKLKFIREFFLICYLM